MSEYKKLHIGCGKRYLEGYIHIDIDKYNHIDYCTEVDNLGMFEDSSVDLIYASHVIEYFDLDEVNKVFLEWKRVLVKGGILRIAVPNFESLTSIYNQTKNLDLALFDIS